MPGAWSHDSQPWKRHQLPEKLPGAPDGWLPGTLCVWDPVRGFGFIKPLGEALWDRTNDLYCHCRQLSGTGRGGVPIIDLKQGMDVIYEPGWDMERNRKAAIRWVAVDEKCERTVDEDDDDKEMTAQEWRSMKSEAIRNAHRFKPYNPPPPPPPVSADGTFLLMSIMHRARMDAIASMLQPVIESGLIIKPAKKDVPSDAQSAEQSTAQCSDAAMASLTDASATAAIADQEQSSAPAPDASSHLALTDAIEDVEDVEEAAPEEQPHNGGLHLMLAKQEQEIARLRATIANRFLPGSGASFSADEDGYEWHDAYHDE
eukprot:CAMPEP_0117479102 /NCGR_PEP_ID=MMETSP0784-20121206/11708_1 /TAXON_ID=39447 /ORGANISM="" /LENGTH=315 /DNA_ID=CAMNT_0005273511 /DNA_START=67 /DNA_END=1014 /DNA_ORIENTATION=-